MIVSHFNVRLMPWRWLPQLWRADCSIVLRENLSTRLPRHPDRPLGLGPGPGGRGNKPDKVDKALAGKLHPGATLKVIITSEPGYRDNFRRHLVKHGGRIKAEHPSLNLLVTESTSEVLEFAKNKSVKALSLDGPVYGQQISLL